MNRVETAIRLQEARDGIRRLLGDKWPETVAALRPEIEGLMKARNTTNPIEAVIPAAKAMRADGKSPIVLLAVAVEMVAP